MKSVSYIIIIASLTCIILFSCKQNAKDRLVKELDSSYTQVISFIKHRNDMEYFLLSLSYQMNKIQLEAYIKKADKLFKIANDFFEYSEKARTDSSGVFDIADLQKRYSNSIDSMSVLVNRNYRPKKPPAKDYSFNSDETTSDLTIKMMQFDLTMYENELLNRIRSETVILSDYWISAEMKASPLRVNKKDAYSFTLQIDNSRVAAVEHKQLISIDTIKCNGKMIKKKDHGKTTDIWTVGNIYLDSLDAGDYCIKGTYKKLISNGELVTYPFEHSFIIPNYSLESNQ
jgi:hypothetical protein